MNPIQSRNRITLSYQRVTGWPALAWLARCRPGSDLVDVLHGDRVEVAPDWFCEAVWDGPYEAGDFDRTDLIFGSGGRPRGETMTFVSSGSTVDRLQTLKNKDGTWVSNSLPCLLAAAGGAVDPIYPHYFRDFSSIRMGLSRYAPLVTTSVGMARLTYFHNLTWNGEHLFEAEKPGAVRDFGAFESYRGFLEGALERIAENGAASERRHPFRLLGTISSGYDSPTVATLARPAGLREVISFDHMEEDESDSGREIAGSLGLKVTLVPRDAWRATPLAEVPFLAADAKGEDIFFTSAEASLSGTVLLTGFHGDKVWGKDTTTLGPDIVRGDQSGLSLTEYRLRAGFVHCPVPFMGVRQIRDINRISRSPALEPWDVAREYTRPICRRIVEQAGVAGALFGVRKKASSVLFFHESTFLATNARSEYELWLKTNAAAWRRVGRVPPTEAASGWTGGLRSNVTRAATYVRTAIPSSAARNSVVAKAARWIAGLADREPLFRWVYPWASERAQAAYAGAAVLSG